MILPKTTSEQRARFYGDVETLLSPGFLTHSLVVAGVRLQVRSLSPGDLFMLKARAEGANTREWRVWLLASSVWMVEGQSVLGVDGVIPILRRFFQQLPDRVLTILFSVTLGLFARVQRAIPAVSVYVYEPDSRYKWVTFGREGAWHLSGVPGAKELGSNLVQQLWMAFNLYEDQRILADRQWDGFKLVASSNAPKAVKKLDDKDQQRARSEQEHRDAARDRFFYERVGVLQPKGSSATAGVSSSSHRLATKSVEDLEDEMRRWVTGDADLHDRVVEDYKNKIRAQHEQVQADREARKMALQMERDRLDREAREAEFKPQPLLALTGAQLQQMLQGRGSRPGVAFIPTAPHADRLYQKYLAEGAVTEGNLQMAGDKVRDPEANPEADRRTLDDLIRGRHPTFKAGR